MQWMRPPEQAGQSSIALTLEFDRRGEPPRPGTHAGVGLGVETLATVGRRTAPVSPAPSAVYGRRGRQGQRLRVGIRLGALGQFPDRDAPAVVYRLADAERMGERAPAGRDSTPVGAGRPASRSPRSVFSVEGDSGRSPTRRCPTRESPGQPRTAQRRRLGRAPRWLVAALRWSPTSPCEAQERREPYGRRRRSRRPRPQRSPYFAI